MTAEEPNDSAPYNSPERNTKPRDTWVPMMTVFILFATLVVIGFQAFIYKQQLKVMEAQTRISETSFRISQRAYIGLASLKANLDERQIVMEFENLGRIPAKNIRVEAWEYRVSDQKISGMLVPIEVREIQLLPGNLKMRLDIPLTDLKPEEIQAIRTGKETLSLSGSVQYDNGFGEFDTTNFGLDYRPKPKEGWTTQVHPELFNQELQRRGQLTQSGIKQ